MLIISSKSRLHLAACLQFIDSGRLGPRGPGQPGRRVLYACSLLTGPGRPPVSPARPARADLICCGINTNDDWFDEQSHSGPGYGWR